VNPQLLARLAEGGVPVVALSELPRRLEDVYLSIISDTAERGVWSASAPGAGRAASDQGGAQAPAGVFRPAPDTVKEASS
jgi:hypothetical protein